ncbi:hypothetical protein H4R21_002705, partial [Coemansia helicoidea]
MLLRSLPEDILAVVLRQCVCGSYSQGNSLKCSLPLLAVCRQWRRLAAPMVCGHVYVQYGDRPTRGDGTFIRSPSAAEPADVAVKTNLDLIAMAGCARAVRRVQVDVHYMANPFQGWREVVQRMRAVATSWRAVELTVAMHPVFSALDASSVDLARHADDIAEVSDALAALVPGVRRLECGGTGNSPVARSLYGRLASHYADQLQRLLSRHPIAVPPDCRFARLKKLDISYDRAAGYRLPQMAAGELVDMRLLHWPPSHSWAPFSTGRDSRVVAFAELKRLRVVYGGARLEDGAALRHRGGHPWKLHFPSLKHLDVHCSQGTCPLLEYAVLPSRMESISIHTTSVAYRDIANLALPATKRLSLCISPKSRGDPAGLPAINRILESARGCEIVELDVHDRALAVAPESISCAALTHLQVRAPTGVDTVLALIERLPNLVRMAFYDLDLSGIQTDMSVPDADESTAVEPLHTSLASLAINYDTERHSPDTALGVVKYLLLRIPTLTELIAIQAPNSPVVGFVEAYAP